MDEPARTSVVVHAQQAVVFSGWAFSQTAAEVHVEVVGSAGSQAAIADRPRPDVRAHFARAGIDAPARCGFRVALAAPPPGEYRIRFRADDRVVEGGTYELKPFSSMQWDEAQRQPREEPPPTRAHYKETWNASAVDVDTAKVAVAGYTSEADFADAAAGTLAVLRQTVGIRPEDDVVEIGCGVARMAPVLAPICRHWTGVDVSENMLGHARSRTEEFKNVSFAAVNGWDLAPLADASFDVVYCTVVFMHLDEWDRFNYVCEAKRVLRPGGRLYVDNFNLLSKAGWDFFMKHATEIHPLDRPPNISKSSTPDELRCYLERAGFESVKLDTNDAGWVYAWGIKPVD